MPVMIRVVSTAGALAVLLATPALAAELSAPARAAIVDPAAVRMNWMLAMPTVQGGTSGASFVGSMPSMGMAMVMMPSNAGLMVRREDATGAPVTAPANFQVMRNQGDGGLIVRTGSGADIRVADNGAIVGGAIVGGAAASIAVARSAGMTVGERAAAPVATNTLVVVVQYN